jgi:hypothetical protein
MNHTCSECGHTDHVHFKYSPTKPTMEGWYWYVGVEYGGPVVMHVYPRPGHNYLCVEVSNWYNFAGKREFKPIARMSGQWSERIPAPF